MPQDAQPERDVRPFCPQDGPKTPQESRNIYFWQIFDGFGIDFWSSFDGFFMDLFIVTQAAKSARGGYGRPKRRVQDGP